MPSIQPVNLSAIDLNLLVVLEALLEERNVTHAGHRIGLTQPATSNALGRLRALLGDPLLVRSGREHVLTPRAEALRHDLGEALARVRHALRDPTPFSPATCSAVFRVGMSDYAAFLLLPGLRRRLAERAPAIGISVIPVEVRTAERLLDERVLDVAIDVFGDRAPEGPHRDLLDDDFVCVMRADHPLAGARMTRKRFVAHPHLLVSPGGQREGVVDRALAELALARDVAVTVPHFLLAPHLIAASDLLGVLAGRIARAVAAPLGLVLRAPPLTLPGFTLTMVWHHRLDADPAHAWLRRLLVEAADALV
jgi:DNA-binding transcriptional LysR family regulator